jgi:predicted Fe-S protein YdhL (DUF1289 family)
MFSADSFIPVEITAASPCIGHCSTVLGDEVCRSCLRTFDEITRWVEMNDAERCAVNQRIAILKTTGFPPARE